MLTDVSITFHETGAQFKTKLLRGKELYDRMIEITEKRNGIRQNDNG